MPRVSVIMPVYNVENYLAQSILSVLNQSFTDFELICIDDCSTDSSLRILNSFRDKDSRIIIIENKKNIGVQASRNIGLRIAQGEFIALHDSDDYSCEERFNIQVEYLDAHVDVIALGSGMIFVDENGNIQKYLRNFEEDILIRCHALFTCPIANPTFIIRHEVIKIVGGYNENLTRSEDYDLISRILPYGKLANIPDYLVYYRRHEGQLSQSSYLTRQNRFYILQKITENYWPGKNHISDIQIISDVVCSYWQNTSAGEVNISSKNVWELVQKLMKKLEGTLPQEKKFGLWLTKKLLRFYGYKLRKGDGGRIKNNLSTLSGIYPKILISTEFFWYFFQYLIGPKISAFVFKKIKHSKSMLLKKIK